MSVVTARRPEEGLRKRGMHSRRRTHDTAAEIRKPFVAASRIDNQNVQQLLSVIVHPERLIATLRIGAAGHVEDE